MKIDLEVLRGWLAAHGFDVKHTVRCDIRIEVDRKAWLEVTHYLLDQDGKYVVETEPDRHPKCCIERIPLKSWPSEHIKEALHGE